MPSCAEGYPIASKRFRIGFLLAVVFLGAAIPRGTAATNPLIFIDEEDRTLAETGLILFDQAIERYWSGMGTQQGNLGLINRADRVYAYISDPAARYYLMAKAELYKGRFVAETQRRRKARPYFEEAMKLAERSLSYRDSSDAYRVGAEAAYEWLNTRRFRGESKTLPKVEDWSRNAIYLDPFNAAASLVNLQTQVRQADDDEDLLSPIRVDLLELEAREDLTDVIRFRCRLLLFEIDEALFGKDEASLWCQSAAEVFPNNHRVRDCQ